MARRFNSPFDMMPLLLRKLKMERGMGGVLALSWPSHPCFARFLTLKDTMVELSPSLGVEDQF